MAKRTSGNNINMTMTLIDKMAAPLKNINRELNKTAATLEATSKTFLNFADTQERVAKISRQNTQLRYQAIALNNLKKHNNAMELEAVRHANKMQEIYARNMYSTAATTSPSVDLASNLYIIEKIAQAIEKIAQTVNNIMEFSDEIVTQKARLNLYNTSGQSTQSMYNLVAGTALESRSDLSATANLTNRLLEAGIFTGENAIPNAAYITGLINKTLSGRVSQQELSSTLLQLSQGLAQGELQGQELRAIRQYAPYLGNILIEGLNKQGIFDKELVYGDLKELGSQGELTTERIIKAFELMADKINADFETMPKTWGQGMETLSTLASIFVSNLNEMDTGIKDVNESLWQFIDYLKSDEAITFWQNMTIAANIFFVLVSLGIDALTAGLQFVVENLNSVLTVLGIIVAALFISFVALNLPLLGVVAILYIIIKVLSALGIDGVYVFSMIISTIVMLILTFKTLADIISTTLVAAFYFLKFVAASVISVILELVQLLAKGIENVLSLFDKHIDISGKLQTAIDWANNVAEDSYANSTEAVDKLGEHLYDLGIGNLDKSWQVGEQIRETAKTLNPENFINGLFGGITMPNFTYPSMTNGAVDTNIVGGKLDDVSISEEDIQLLRDIAARDFLINVSTVTPVMNNTFGDIRETADINKILEELDRMVDEELATSVVYG